MIFSRKLDGVSTEYRDAIGEATRSASRAFNIRCVRNGQWTEIRKSAVTQRPKRGRCTPVFAGNVPAGAMTDFITASSRRLSGVGRGHIRPKFVTRLSEPISGSRRLVQHRSGDCSGFLASFQSCPPGHQPLFRPQNIWVTFDINRNHCNELPSKFHWSRVFQ
jgi:hypothetical protein